MNEEQRQAWNAALASGDQGLIERMQHELLDEIFTRMMDDDANYAIAGWRSADRPRSAVDSREPSEPQVSSHSVRHERPPVVQTDCTDVSLAGRTCSDDTHPADGAR